MQKRSDSATKMASAAASSASVTASSAKQQPQPHRQQQQQQQQQQQACSASTSGVSSSNSSNSNSSTGSAVKRNSSKSPGASTSGANGSCSGAEVRTPDREGGSGLNGDQYFSSLAMKSLKDAFNFFDIDHDGRITSGELQKVLKFLGSKVTEHEVKLMIADVDSDGNGTVEFNEFLKMMKKYYNKTCEEHSEDADMWEAFKAFDHNGDNFIDFAEIKKTMHFLGEEVSDEDVRSMIREADVDNDGRINFEEFKKMMAVMQQKGSQS